VLLLPVLGGTSFTLQFLCPEVEGKSASSFFLRRKHACLKTVMAHIYNPIYLGDRDGPTQGKS
jgi:hypothetical protein